MAYSNNVLAGIVTYNPDMDNLRANIDAVAPQVDAVLLVDNGSGNVGEIECLAAEYAGTCTDARVDGVGPTGETAGTQQHSDGTRAGRRADGVGPKKTGTAGECQHPAGTGVTLLRNGANLGIAAALNRIFRYAASRGYEWVLTLDQDSCVDADFMAACGEYMNLQEPTANGRPECNCAASGSGSGAAAGSSSLCSAGVASITTLRRDRNSDWKNEYDPDAVAEEIDKCITSGNLVRVSAWQAVGGFNEPLFIDAVDHEFCYRLREAGFRIVRVNRCLLTHELGASRNVPWVGRKAIVLGHSAWRKYHMYRNTVYMLRFLPLSREGNSVEGLCKTFVKTILYEDHKWDKITSSLRGVRDGLRMTPTDFAAAAYTVTTQAEEAEFEQADIRAAENRGGSIRK